MVEHFRQHWIPEAYLSAWCDPHPERQNPRRVHRYAKSDGRYIDYRPYNRIFTVPELYTVPGPDGGRDLRTEYALGRPEDSFVRLRDRVLAHGAPLTRDGRRDLLRFIAALRNRSPAMHAHHTKFNERVLEVADDLAEGLQAMSAEERTAFAKLPGPPSVDREDGISLAEFRELADQPFGAYLPQHVVAEASLLEQMHLSLLRMPEDGQCLITSDNPVVWWDPSDPPPSRRPLGLGRRRIEITVPVTPFLCAVISHDPGPDFADVDAAVADEINMRTLYRCREVFLSREPNLVVDWLDEPSSGA